MIIWLSGLSGAGKTTIASSFKKLAVVSLGIDFVIVDGDVVRSVFPGDLGYDIQSRMLQIERIQSIAKFLDINGLNVVVTAVYFSELIASKNRSLFEDYIEVHVDTPLAVVAERDVKGLYKDYENNSPSNMVGFDIPWTPPSFPNLVLSGYNSHPDCQALQIIEYIKSSDNNYAKN